MAVLEEVRYRVFRIVSLLAHTLASSAVLVLLLLHLFCHALTFAVASLLA